MLVIVSTSSTDRYRHNTISLLAQPIGSTVQFRYSEQLLPDKIIKAVQENKLKGSLALVGHIEKRDGICPIYPIRQVELKQAYQHGSTYSFEFIMGGFTYCEEPQNLADELAKEHDPSSEKIVPNIDKNDPNKTVKGFFIFEAQDFQFDNHVKFTKSLIDWEKISNQLYKLKIFNNEPYFFTVVGLEKGQKVRSDVQECSQWPSQIVSDKLYNLLIYVYHPLKDNWTVINEHLKLESNFLIHPINPKDLLIDSPYDLRRWPFKFIPTTTVHNEFGWFKIGPQKKNDGGDKGDEFEWSFAMDLKLKIRRLRIFVSIVIPAIALAIPGISLILLKSDDDIKNMSWFGEIGDPGVIKFGLSFLVLASTTIASIASLYGIKRSI